MRELPIIFNPGMVRAVLDGRKTQTRRPVKPQPTAFYFGENPVINLKSKRPCQVGDRLYVREKFRLYDRSTECACYEHCCCPPSGTPLYYADTLCNEDRWKPSIHMPKKYARIWLEVTDVRVQRVQDITRKDAAAEGVCYPRGEDGPVLEQNFGHLWDSIYSNWNDDPWVWVIEFKHEGER